jgi:hypothetical protein
MLAAVMALSLSACGGSSATPTPEPSTEPIPTEEPTAAITPTAEVSVGGWPAAKAALANLTSYKFTMTLVGADYPESLSSLLTDSTTPVAVSGVVILKPAPAADLDFHGLLRIISLDGFDYYATDIEAGYSRFAQATADPSASPAASAPPTLADAISPAHEFGLLASSLKGYEKVGTENKNGVQADHYQGTQTALAEFGSIAGVKNATSWTADIWIAATGGYPVSVAVIAKAKDESTVYQMSIDITHVDDPANKVTAPENVTGA